MYINVFLHDFGNCKGNEIVTANADGGYTVLINSRLSSADQLDAYAHALRHIKNDDFCKQDVQTIESRNHDVEKKKTP